MAFDAYFLSAVLDEMRPVTEGARVEKIHMPGKDTVVLHLRCAGGRRKLLIAANPAAPRLHLTEASPENPEQPPMFCMLLRKHLSGARLEEIRQAPMERMVRFTFSGTGELGDPTRKSLVAELMGKTCNLYLLDEDDRISDCLRRVGLDSPAGRPALPGLRYQAPVPVTKKDPRVLTPAEYEEILRSPGEDMLSLRLMDSLGGLSPLVCREAALYACGDPDARASSAEPAAAAEKLALFFREHLLHPTPWVYADAEGTPRQFAFLPIRQYGSSVQADSFGQLLDAFYSERDRRDSFRQKSQSVRKTVTNLCQRLERKLAVQEQELAQTYDREKLRRTGDIVMANISRITKGQTVLTAQDFYDPEMKTIKIRLSPTLSPQGNAAKYYKDYARMKTAETELTNQLSLGRRELAYLKSVLSELERAQTEPELAAIREELTAGGYLKEPGKKRMKTPPLPPMRFVSADGFPIYVGRNNVQNEELTFRLARKDDLWLHAQKVHGSHVIISCNGATPPDDTVTQAAQLAAYYADTVNGQNVPVDVTPVRQIKKIPGGKPGMVIYHTYRTVVVDPCPDIR